jgi:hypothetical protein
MMQGYICTWSEFWCPPWYVCSFCGTSTNVLQMYKRVPLEKSCICSIYDARNLTICTTHVAVPKSLVLLFGVDMPHANAQKLSWSTPIIGHGTSTYKIAIFRGILQEKYNIGCISEVIHEYYRCCISHRVPGTPILYSKYSVHCVLCKLRQSVCSLGSGVWSRPPYFLIFFIFGRFTEIKVCETTEFTGDVALFSCTTPC